MPAPWPLVNVTIYEVRRDIGGARWRVGADAVRADLDHVDWNFGPGAEFETAPTDRDNRINVEYNVQGQKEIRWTATVTNGETLSGRRFITFEFPMK
jgi:hypothetical protein